MQTTTSSADVVVSLTQKCLFKDYKCENCGCGVLRKWERRSFWSWILIFLGFCFLWVFFFNLNAYRIDSYRNHPLLFLPLRNAQAFVANRFDGGRRARGWVDFGQRVQARGSGYTLSCVREHLVSFFFRSTTFSSGKKIIRRAKPRISNKASIVLLRLDKRDMAV